MWLSLESGSNVEMPVFVWPLARSTLFKDVCVLQQYLNMSSTSCDGTAIELLHMSDCDAVALRSSMSKVELEDEKSHPLGLGHDINLAHQLWPMIHTFEKDMLSEQGKLFTEAVRNALSELQGLQVGELAVPNHIRVSPGPIVDDITPAGTNEPSVIRRRGSLFQDYGEQIEPDEAQAITDTCWVSTIEARIAADKLSSSRDHQLKLHPRNCKSRLVRLRFDRHPAAFDEAIMKMPLAMQLAERGIDIQPAWANGAKVLDGDAQFLVDEARMVLAPFDVIVREVDEKAVHAALRAIEWNKRPKLKQGKGRFVVCEDGLSSLFHGSPSSSRVSSVSDLTGASSSDDECPVGPSPIAYAVRRTFIHFEQRDDNQSRCRARSV